MKDILTRSKPVMAMLCIVAATVWLSGCATMGKKECLHAEWQTIGYEDGTRGLPASRIGKHRKACAKYGVAPDLALYEEGRQRGLEIWCVPSNGYRLGTQGKRYNGACPQSREAAFMEAMDRGRALYAYGKEVKKAEAELKEMHTELEAMEGRIKTLEQEMVSDRVSPRRRMQLLEEIRIQEEDRRLFLNDISDTTLRVEDMKRHLEEIRQENPYD